MFFCFACQDSLALAKSARVKVEHANSTVTASLIHPATVKAVRFVAFHPQQTKGLHVILPLEFAELADVIHQKKQLLDFPAPTQEEAAAGI